MFLLCLFVMCRCSKLPRILILNMSESLRISSVFLNLFNMLHVHFKVFVFYIDLTWFWLEPPNCNAFLSSFRGLDWHILARSLLRCPAPAWPACAFCCCQPGSQCYVKLGWWSCRANKDIMLYQGRHIFREAEGGRYDVKWYQNITPTIQVT